MESSGARGFSRFFGRWKKSYLQLANQANATGDFEGARVFYFAYEVLWALELVFRGDEEGAAQVLERARWRLRV